MKIKWVMQDSVKGLLLLRVGHDETLPRCLDWIGAGRSCDMYTCLGNMKVGKYSSQLVEVISFFKHFVIVSLLFLPLSKKYQGWGRKHKEIFCYHKFRCNKWLQPHAIMLRHMWVWVYYSTKTNILCPPYSLWRQLCSPQVIHFMYEHKYSVWALT